MALSIPRPMKRTGTVNHQLIQRIPADVLAKVRGSTVSIPIGDQIVTRALSAKAVDVRVLILPRFRGHL